MKLIAKELIQGNPRKQGKGGRGWAIEPEKGPPKREIYEDRDKPWQPETPTEFGAIFSARIRGIFPC